MTPLILAPPLTDTLAALISQAGERAGVRFLEFFTATVRNPHTRRAYARTENEFLGWCCTVGVPSITAMGRFWPRLCENVSEQVRESGLGPKSRSYAIFRADD